MKIIGFDLFQLDLDNKSFNDMDGFFTNHEWLRQVYYGLTLYLQVLLMTAIVHRRFDKKIVLYSLAVIPFGITIRVVDTIFTQQLGMWKSIIEIIYLIIATSMFKLKKIPRSIFCVLVITLYQFISLQTRSLEIKSNNYGFVANQILNIDFYIMMYLHKEVAIMDGGTFIFFGPTEWLYKVAGFIVGIFKGHPIQYARKYGAKGKAIEDARKAERTPISVAEAK
jgi:hypothetical protein